MNKDQHTLKTRKTAKDFFQEKKLLWLIVDLLAVIFLLTAFGIPGGKGHTVNVEKGWGTVEVAGNLEKQGIIRSKTAFEALAVVTGSDRKWKYGSHHITGRGYMGIIRELTTARPEGIKITIPEGYQAKQIGSLLEEKGICTREAFLDACVNHSFNYPFLKGLPVHQRISGLEGYLFPDTYYFSKNTDPDVIINAMLKRFDQKVNTKSVKSRAQARGLTLDQVVILASMVESEARTRSDRDKVAAVFMNRLKNPEARLGSCVTVEYAKGMKKTIISYEDTQFDSPYNTYLNPGLPFGPICCPGLDSINAVLDHKDTTYYYFQSDKYGNLHFATTYEEHLANQKKLQKDWKTGEGKKI